MAEDKISRVVFVIAFRDFRDPEYFIPRQILEEGGAEVKTASDKKGLAIGAEGGEAEIDFLVSEVTVEEFDGVIFVGGPGCLDHLDNNESYELAEETVQKGKLLASICISPVILAKAGVLEGKKATVWSSEMNKQGVKKLKEQGAEYLDEPVVEDEGVITACGPSAAKQFGKAVLSALTEDS
ncbi:MAG: hypothetical protein GF370_04995 [Candidatus Nealsonbacteria bacterium]|nr:hypothetical protein [Candidatus Nealsonbacteria bacterium]